MRGLLSSHDDGSAEWFGSRMIIDPSYPVPSDYDVAAHFRHVEKLYASYRRKT